MARTRNQEMRAKTPCALCGERLSSPDGEHVLPQGLLRALFPQESGPFTTTWGPKEAPRRTLIANTFQRVKLPCCEPCNKELNRRFENPGSGTGRRLLSDIEPCLSGDELKTAAIWLLKTWLLLVHPKASANDGLPQPKAWDSAPPSVWTWLVDGSDPPEGLTLWIQDGAHPVVAPGQEHHLLLPLIRADGGEWQFLGFALGLARRYVSLVYHPGWAIEHPGVAAGTVKQLWPPTGASSLIAFPDTPAPVVRFVGGSVVQFRDGILGHRELPPMVPDELPDHRVRQWVRYMSI